jgi:hypothetical protein
MCLTPSANSRRPKAVCGAGIFKTCGSAQSHLRGVRHPIRHDPIITAFYERLLEKGKKPVCALVAIMRKLLHGIIGMLKTGTDFDAQRLFPNIRAVGV